MKEWYYLKDKEKIGPLTEDTVKELINSYEIINSTKLWKNGMKAWGVATEIDIFKNLFVAAKKIPVPNPKIASTTEDIVPESPDEDITDSDKTYVLIMYLCSIGFCCFGIPGIVMWLIKKDKSEFINRSGKNILNFAITALGISIVTCAFGFVVWPFASVVFYTMAAIKAKNGVYWKIPSYTFLKDNV